MPTIRAADGFQELVVISALIGVVSKIARLVRRSASLPNLSPVESSWCLPLVTSVRFLHQYVGVTLTVPVHLFYVQHMLVTEANILYYNYMFMYRSSRDYSLRWCLNPLRSRELPARVHN